MTFQICCCGAQPGYPHRADCPRPLFNATDAQFEQWEKEWLALREELELSHDAWQRNSSPGGYAQ